MFRNYNYTLKDSQKKMNKNSFKFPITKFLLFENHIINVLVLKSYI